MSIDFLSVALVFFTGLDKGIDYRLPGMKSELEEQALIWSLDWNPFVYADLYWGVASGLFS